MRSGEETVLLATPAWNDPRTHLLDDIWLLAIAAILLAVVVPWLFSSFEIDLTRASLGVLGLGGVHVVFAALASPGRPRTPARSRLLAAVHALGILFIGFIWLYAGGLQNAMFLAVFALPVIGSVFISRWQPYLMSLVAIAVVIVVALVQAPELRWYAAGLRGVGQGGMPPGYVAWGRGLRRSLAAAAVERRRSRASTPHRVISSSSCRCSQFW
jgi:hypothetical protein